MSDLENAVAIVGMDGRFPGCRDLDEYWNNLYRGRETVSFPEEEDMEPNPFEGEQMSEGEILVNAVGVLEDYDKFDAEFFGYSPKEASLMDPQQRVFLESAWRALDHAGYSPSRYDGRIGVVAGSRTNTYAYDILLRRNLTDAISPLEFSICNDLSCLANRVSYKLDLTGPSYSIHTACSTGLAAVHLGVQTLLVGEADMVLAGGVSVLVPNRAGYVYRKGGILSPDGHCAVFDKNSRGTVFGSGVGVVVLKRLEDAIADDDYIFTVVRGSAANNDGRSKASFTAPSEQGQADAIAESLRLAGVQPRDVSYIEAHGTGTKLGDAIEVSALKKVFDFQDGNSKRCGIGSVKSNLGHLDAAAGVAGLIKVALAHDRGEIPATINFDKVSPELGIEGSGLFVVDKNMEWNSPKGHRFAGVSSFGVGGTNVHVVLQDWNNVRRSRDINDGYSMLLFAAKSEGSLANQLGAYVNWIDAGTSFSVRDAEFTLMQKEHGFPRRTCIVAKDWEEARELLAKRAVSISSEVLDFEDPSEVVVQLDLDNSISWSLIDSLCVTKVLSSEAVQDCREIEESLALETNSSVEFLEFVFGYSFKHRLKSFGVSIASWAGKSAATALNLLEQGAVDLEEVLRLLSVEKNSKRELLDRGKQLVSAPIQKETVRIRVECGKITVESYSNELVSEVELRKCESQERAFLDLLGSLWMLGLQVDFSSLRGAERGSRIPLPPYSMERRRHWLGDDRAPAESAKPMKEEKLSNVERSIVKQPSRVLSKEEVERDFAEIWKEVLGVDSCSRDDDFFEVGGHSLLVTYLGSRLMDRFGVSVAVDDLYESPTFGDIVDYLHREVVDRGYENNTDVLEAIDDLLMEGS